MMNHNYSSKISIIYQSQIIRSIQILNPSSQTKTNQINNHPITSKIMVIIPRKTRTLMIFKISEWYGWNFSTVSISPMDSYSREISDKNSED